MLLPIVYGTIVGFSLGLTGGGGSIFAVPLLVYGLGVPGHEAVVISLASVGATSAIGAAERIRRHEAALVVGLLFALAGIFGAPVGARIGARLPDAVLLSGFAVLMVVVALWMWHRAGQTGRPDGAAENPAPAATIREHLRHPANLLRLAGMGLATGVLSGLFGVGGGFLIVPALMVTTGMSIHRAVATSLLAIAIIAASAVLYSSLLLHAPDPRITLLFIAGGVLGLGGGITAGRRIGGPQMQRIFAGFILVTGTLMLVANLAG
ncbi:MAG TPA: sulfite exporter TauE/SafE family protein [Gammaproteobacteria bacterium]|nr:sulfite exporter TauE/SafE family protein [Gammaproteobacteria bacterium]